MRRVCLLFLGLVAATPAVAAPPPEPIVAMLRAAGDGQLDSVASLAKRTNPQSVAEIDVLVATIKAERAEAQQRQLASQRVWEGWKAEAELGGSLSTGNSEQKGVSGRLKLDKEGLHSKHHFNAAADFSESDGEPTRERYLANYQLDRTLSDNFYLYGLLQWERDKFAGFLRRFTESLGAGWTIADSATARLDLQAGTALRQTTFIDSPDERNVNALTNLDFRWNIAPKTRLTEKAGAVFGGGNDTLFSRTALTAGLGGGLAARLSFDVTHETDPPLGRENTDTISRAGLVYSF